MIYFGQIIVQHYEMAVNYLCVCFTYGVIQFLNFEIIISPTVPAVSKRHVLHT